MTDIEMRERLMDYIVTNRGSFDTYTRVLVLTAVINEP